MTYQELYIKRKEIMEKIEATEIEIIKINLEILQKKNVKVGDTYNSHKWGMGQFISKKDIDNTVVFIFSPFRKNCTMLLSNNKYYIRAEDIESDRLINHS